MLILVEYGTESAIDRYFDWWDKQVRARPQRLEQLRIEDAQGLQDALSLDPPKPDKSERQWKADKAWSTAHYHDKGKGRGKGKRYEQRWSQRWNDKKWEDRRSEPYGRYYNQNSSSPSSSWQSWAYRQNVVDGDAAREQGQRGPPVKTAWMGVPDPAWLAPSETASVGAAASVQLQGKKRNADGASSQPQKRVTLMPAGDTKIKLVENNRRPDLILLSFFDSIASAAIVCQELCAARGCRWRAMLWETDSELCSLTQRQHFPRADHRGDIDQDSAAAIIDRLAFIDPDKRALILICAGPPCHDYSRIRSDAPGSHGVEGSKFVRFAEVVRELEREWEYPQALLVVENVVPTPKGRCQGFRASSVGYRGHARCCRRCGVVARPRLWWTRVAWQSLSNQADAPVKLKWSTHQGLPRVHFVVEPDDLSALDTGTLKLPAVIAQERKVFTVKCCLA